MFFPELRSKKNKHKLQEALMERTGTLESFNLASPSVSTLTPKALSFDGIDPSEPVP